MCDTEVDKSHPPEFLTRPKPLAVPEGSTTATFTCRVQGHPLPLVSWERNGCLLSSNEHYKISRDGEWHSLEMVQPLSRDSGQYVCHVQNSAGTASHNCSLIVTESTSTAAAGSSSTVDYRALLKPRQNGGQVRTQRSTDSDRSDKENRAHDFRHVLRNNRQNSLPVSTTTTTSTASTTSSTAASRFPPRTVPNGTSTHNSSATSSVTSTASGRSGGVRRNLDLFEKQASPSPDRSTFTSRRSASPEGRPSSDRLALRSRLTETSETRLSPGQDTVKVSGVPDRRRPEPVQESALTASSLRSSHAAPTMPRERSRERISRAAFAQNTSNSLDRSHWRKSELSVEPSKKDFRSVLSKPQGSSELGRPSAQPSTDSKPSWVRSDHSRDQKRNGHTKDIKQTASGKVDFRGVLKTRQTDNGRASSVTRDNKPKMQSPQSDTDFRSVLARLKQGEEDSKKPAPQKTAPPRGTQETKPMNKSASSKDLNSLRARFESPGKDTNTVQSKPTIPSTIPTTTTTTTTTSITSSGRLGANTSDGTTPHWRERTRERPAPKVVENTKDMTAEDKTLDVPSSVGDTSRSSDDLKCSDSSQLSDSAISSAFSKLSEFSDLSDSSSAVSEMEVQETRSSRRRLERLKERLGGAGSGGEGEEASEAPRIEQRLEDRSVTYGGQVVLQCKVSGSPVPDINWSLNRKTIKPSRFFQLSYQENVAQLLVAEAFSEDEGEYTCTVTNSVGTDSCSCYLTVEGSSSRSSRSGSHMFEGAVSIPPHVETLTPATLTVRRGQSASFQVTFIGEPSPVVTWYRGKTPLLTDERVAVMKEGAMSTLTIPCAGANDCGRYTVTLTNDLGADQLSATLSVEDVPECPVGTPHVYDISRRSVSLSWCGPAYDGGSVVTHYVIEVKDADSKEWSTLADDCKSTSYHALTLKADTPYQFRVRACNRLGLSEPSLSTPSVVMTDPLEDYESDGCSEVFSPTLDYRGRDELPFDPREVTLTPGRKFEDYYEYLHEVGKGKFGSVYKCKDKQTKKVWAAKVLKVREKDKAGVRQEVEVMNRLAHPKLLMLWDAFEAPRTMVLVMEYVGAGELFERVIRDDFVLTERDCVHFVRQICTGVGYMHTQSILHLDLKPENILCVAENSNQIKIIDFGLARFYKPGDSLQVLFGTPEFIAPEVVNYDAINFATDMWSVGVICYILLSGLSPFQGDNEAETLANVTSGEYDFDDESFDDISDKAKDFIGCLLVKRKEKRLTIVGCEKHSWLSEEDERIRCKRLNTDRLRNFMARRKWQKTGNAIRALGRMASMQKLLAGNSGRCGSTDSSISSTSDTPSAAPSASGVTTPVFSPPLHHPTSTHPLSMAAVKEAEEKRETTSAAARTSATTTTTPANTNRWGAERGKGDGSKPTTEINGDLAKTTTTTATDSHPSPSSRRKGGGGGRESGELKTSSSPVVGRRDKLTQQNALQEPADVTDSTPTGHQEEPLSQRAKPTTTTTNNNNGEDNETDNLSPTRQATVTAPGDSKPCAPRFVKEMVDCTAFKGDVARFDVTVTGTPLPHLAWSLEEEEVEADARHVMEVGEKGHCSLIVRHVTEDDEGEYVCRAVNSQGEASCVAELSVYSMGSV